MKLRHTHATQSLRPVLTLRHSPEHHLVLWENKGWFERMTYWLVEMKIKQLMARYENLRWARQLLG